MDIKNLRPDPVEPRPLTPARPVRSDARADNTAADAVRGEVDDRVEISDEARARAAGSEGSDVPSGTLPGEQLLELRRRIQERAHDSSTVADEVMRRIVERGDL